MFFVFFSIRKINSFSVFYAQIAWRCFFVMVWCALYAKITFCFLRFFGSHVDLGSTSF